MVHASRITVAACTLLLCTMAGPRLSGRERPSPGAAPGSAGTIGLLLAGDGPGARDGAEIRHGAEIALRLHAEAVAGGAPRVVAAEKAAQWSAGTGELVRLVYSEGAQAVLGPVDGRSAHLAEQVVARAKGRFVLLAPWATDRTLTGIPIPWFFRLAHDDRAQAAALLGHIHRALGLRNVLLLVAEGDYDARVAADAFAATAGRLELSPPRRIPIPDGQPPAKLVRAAGAEAAVLLAPAIEAAGAARALREAGIGIPLFGPLRLATPSFLEAAGAAAEGMVLAAPAETQGSEGIGFRARYRNAWGRDPAVPAAYGHDGALALLRALSGTSHGAPAEKVRAALAATDFRGLTGTVAFDANGNRTGPAPLSRVERGRLHALPTAELKETHSSTYR